MISKATASIMSSFFGWAEKFHLVRIQFLNWPEYRFRLKPTSKIWYTTSVGGIGLIVILILALLFALIFDEMKISFRICGFAFLTLAIFGMVSQMYLLIYSKDVVAILNDCLSLTKSTADVLDLAWPPETDGIQTILWIFNNILGRGYIVLFFPAGALFIHYADSLTPAFNRLRSDSFLFNLGTGSIFAMAASHCSVCMVSVGNFILLEANSLGTWTPYLWWSEGTNLANKTNPRAVQLLYRRFQLHGIYVNSVFGPWTTPAYYLINLSLITVAYSVIRHVSVLPVVIMLALLFIGTGFALSSAYIYQQIVNLRIASSEVKETHIRGNAQLHPVHSRFWKSCYPIYIHIGDQFTISSKNFILEVFFGFIMDTTISLILSFK